METLPRIGVSPREMLKRVARFKELKAGHSVPRNGLPQISPLAGRPSAGRAAAGRSAHGRRINRDDVHRAGVLHVGAVTLPALIAGAARIFSSSVRPGIGLCVTRVARAQREGAARSGRRGG